MCEENEFFCGLPFACSFSFVFQFQSFLKWKNLFQVLSCFKKMFVFHQRTTSSCPIFIIFHRNLFSRCPKLKIDEKMLELVKYTMSFAFIPPLWTLIDIYLQSTERKKQKQEKSHHFTVQQQTKTRNSSIKMFIQYNCEHLFICEILTKMNFSVRNFLWIFPVKICY